MIETMLNTSVSDVAKRLVSIRTEGGVSALGRVLTLVIATDGALDENAVEAANMASSEHPMRVIVVITQPQAEARLDAEIRVGSDVGASEVILLRAYGDVCTGMESLVTGLLLPDAPVVVWWPAGAPANPGAHPLGHIAQRRITDYSSESHRSHSVAPVLNYTPGDTDLAWTRVTRWREYLAAILDQPPFEPVVSVEVVGEPESLSAHLLAAWLEDALQVPTVLTTASHHGSAEGVHAVTLSRPHGDAVIRRVSATHAILEQPGQPSHEISLPHRRLSECLAEELRGFDEDVMYGRVLAQLEVQRARATK